MTDRLAALYDRVDGCTSCALGTRRLPLLTLHGAGCKSRPDIMFVAINPSLKNATIKPEWRGSRLAWVPTKKRKPKFWELLIRAGLLKVSPKLQQRIFDHLTETETVEELADALQRNKILLTELVKCPTRGQKDLKQDMIDTCSRAFLSEEIWLSSPRVICSWGRLPFFALTGSSERLGDVIGRLGRLKALRIDDLPKTTKEFGTVPCFLCYFHLQAPVDDKAKVRHLQRLKLILETA